MSGNWMFWRKKENASAGKEGASAIDYIDWLLSRMIRKSIFDISVSGNVSLPDDADSAEHRYPAPLPTHETVINRLKVMSDLSPVYLPEPTKGKFELPRGNHVFVFHSEFDDRGSRPRCKLRMKIRRV